MAYAKNIEKTEYIKSLEIATNPKHVVPIGKYETIERIKQLEEKIKKNKNIDRILDKIFSPAISSYFITGGALLVSAFANDTLAAICTIANVSVLAVSLTTMIAIPINVSNTKKNKLKLKKLQDVLNPKKRFKEILEKEQKRLEQYERLSEGLFHRNDLRENVSHLYDENYGDIAYVEMEKLDELSGHAKKHLSNQRKIVSVLDASQGFIDTCDDEEKISKLLELAENPTKENLVSMQRIISNTLQTETKPKTNRALSSASLAESRENLYEN